MQQQQQQQSAMAMAMAGRSKKKKKRKCIRRIRRFGGKLFGTLNSITFAPFVAPREVVLTPPLGDKSAW
jgi:hypothetical protein